MDIVDVYHPLAAVAAQDVTIKGKDFYLDGKPWLPKGIDVEAFNRPIGNYESVSLQKLAKQVRSDWGPAEMDTIKTVFGSRMIRFTVSQPGLDPQSSIYSAAYRDELLAAFKQARDAGFVLVVSMDAQAENGIPNLPCMPNEGAVRAWKMLAPRLSKDDGVMFELFDEPCKWSKPENQKEWVQGMQPIIDAVRSAGAKNILLIDGLWYGRQTNGLFPLLHDTLPNRMALAVHPYLVKDAFVNEKQWQDMFGASAAQYPMIASEWNAVDGCVGENMPDLALSMIRYLQSLHVGVIGWAIDSGHGKLVRDHEKFEPIDYRNFHGCVPGIKDHAAPPGNWGGGRLLANFPNN